MIFCIHPYCLGTDIDDVLPLPQWSSGTAQNAPPLGGKLLPDELAEDSELDLPARLSQQPPSMANQIEASRQSSDLSLFLPDALLGKAIRPFNPSQSKASQPLREVDAAFLAACRETQNDEHLIDPDSHVTETQREDLLRFLGFHARDARIKAYVVVLESGQTIPASTDLSGMASGALSNQDSCLAIYPLGELSQARLVFSNSVKKIAASEYLAGVVADCISDAAQVSDPLEQLHRFTVRLSIRLFWLERMIGTKGPALTRSGIEDISNEIVSKREAALLKSALDEKEPAGSHSDLQLSSIILGAMLSLAGGALTLAALRYRRKRLLSFVWILPEIEIPPRLGGAFTGGGGCSIQFR